MTQHYCHWKEISWCLFLCRFFSFILYWLCTLNSSAGLTVLKRELTRRSAERLQQKLGRAGGQVAPPLRSPWCWSSHIEGSEGSSFHTPLQPLGFVPSTLEQSRQAAVLGLPLRAHPSTGSQAGATAYMHCNKKPQSSADIRKGSTGSEWLELLVSKRKLILF